MMKVRKSFTYLFVTCFFFLFSCITIKAADATYNLVGEGSVYVGNNITISVRLSNVNNQLNGVGGTLSYDKSYLELVSASGMNNPFGVRFSSATNNFTGLSYDGSTVYNNLTIITFTFKALRTGQTTVNILSPGDGSSLLSGGIPSIYVNSKTISIVNPPSSNANLSSLSVSGASINFNPSTTSYSVKVGKDVSSVTVNASAEDAGARVSGTGSKSLNYGANSISVTVTAPSGATKTYTINVTREDPRSGNNNLSSLKVDGGTLSPEFNQNTTVYEVSVPFSVETLNVKVNPQDGKAKVSVSGNQGLVSEETRDVVVTVTAENGAKKTYTIKVTRGKDPNKVLATNNYLSSLTTNTGILSPAFDKEKTNYIIYLPYEIDTIELNATVEDTRYGFLAKDGPEKLAVGSNKYTFTVTAEDSSTRVYTIVVMRGASLNAEQVSNNVLLKELKVDKGSLDKPFNSKVNVYRYDKNKGFKLNPIPEDEEAKIITIENDDVISIIVESGSETNVYTLIPKEENSIVLIVSIIAGSTIFVAGGSFIGYKIGLKKTING